MSTNHVQLHSMKLFEKVNAESNISYLEFVKMTEHAVTPTRESLKPA